MISVVALRIKAGVETKLRAAAILSDFGVIGCNELRMTDGKRATFHELHDLVVVRTRHILLQHLRTEIAVGMRTVENGDMGRAIDNADFAVNLPLQAWWIEFRCRFPRHDRCDRK